MSEPTREEMLAEAYRRGILPDDMKSAYEEAMRRGLVQTPSVGTAPVAEQTSTAPTSMEPAHTTPIPADMQLQAAHTKMAATADTVNPAIRAISPYYRMGLEGGGAVAGGLLGSGAGPAGAVLGSGLLYGAGKKGADILDEFGGIKKPQPIGQQLIGSAQDVATGAAFEMGGQAAVPVLQKGAELVGKTAKPLLGRLSGVGTGAIDESLKGSKDFVKAMRGDITGEEVVNNAKSALYSLKEQRASAYQAQLDKISKIDTPVDTTNLTDHIANLMKKYNIQVDPVTGKLDTSRIAMGKTGRQDIEDVLDTINSWGTKPDDVTPKGMDVLKRQLDDFYSDSSQARQFVSSARKAVKDTIVDAVPEYDTMTKGYSEATQLIKDIESGLMMRKQNMTGRITGDQTLRRLMSSMKDNFALRKDLVDILGAKGDVDVAGQVAGHMMRSPMPMGLSGTGPSIAGQAAYAMINPKFWPVLAASSPRVQGEFLRYFGKISPTPTAIKEGVRQGLIANDIDQNQVN